MKNKIKTGINSFSIICLLLLTTACDLPLQEGFTFNPNTAPQVTFGSRTAWEWIQTNPKGEFTYLKEAIELTGLQDEYNSPTNTRTFFLIKDIGWTDPANGILAGEFGNANELLENVDVAVLRKILLYHILPVYLDQGPGYLKSLEVNVKFNTVLQDGVNNKMSVRRLWEYNLEINRDQTLPDTKKVVGVALHNYIFSNGNSVAHLLNGYARLAPFE